MHLSAPVRHWLESLLGFIGLEAQTLPLTSTPSDGKANRVQKCSLSRAWLSGKRVRGDAEVSHCRADLFLGPLVCKAVGERRVQQY